MIAHIQALEDQVVPELLARISLMTGLGFGLDNIASRLHIDTGYRLSASLVQVLQGELGLVRMTPRVELQARLLAHGMSPAEAARVANMVWEQPAEAGILLASRGLMNRGSRILLGAPRALAAVCKAGANLWRVAMGHTAMPLPRLQRLMAEAGLSEKDLTRLIPGSEAAFNGVRIRVNLPRGQNPFKPSTKVAQGV